jgi:hypothetical protein
VRASTANVVATANYFDNRSIGNKSTRSFYSNIGDVSPAEIKQKADLVNSLFQKYVVPKERTIKDFVEEKTKHGYIKGEAFYQLTKTEKVQDHKEIIVEDRSTSTLFGGQGTRDILGLPTYGEVRVHPGDHGNYDIYVQSTSVNRLLVRGSKVLVRK